MEMEERKMRGKKPGNTGNASSHCSGVTLVDSIAANKEKEERKERTRSVNLSRIDISKNHAFCLLF
jgi:hypothetical protein